MPRMESAAAHRLADAERRIRATGARITVARVQVLALLLDAECALGHQEIERQLAGDRIDRVTLYRVLDWLVSSGLAHRTLGGDRMWRFMAKHGRHAQHAHFHCSGCGTFSCLDDSATPRVRLPRGYRGQAVDITVQGLCGACAG